MNADKFRERCAKRIYDNTMKGGMFNKAWRELQPGVREGFHKMVAEVFAELFNADPSDVIEYFTGLEVKVEKYDAKN